MVAAKEVAALRAAMANRGEVSFMCGAISAEVQTESKCGGF